MIGKRSIGKYNCEKKLSSAYKLYKKKFIFKTSGSKYANSDPNKLAILYPVYKSIINDFTSILLDEILKANYVKLPYNLGTLSIQKKKINFTLQSNALKTDWGHLHKTGKIIKHLNEHRNMHRYRFYWRCVKGPINKNYYKFEPMRKNKRTLATILKTTNQDYFE